MVLADTSEINSNVTVNHISREEALHYQKQTQKKDAPENFEITAYETDLNGNVTAVDPLHLGDSLSLRIPNDNNVYSPSTYSQVNGNLNQRFKGIGSFTVYNRGSQDVNASYEQQESVTTNWSVNGTISGNAAFKNAFIGEVGVKIAAGAAFSKTVSKGTKYSASTKVGPGKTLNIDAYQKGGKSSGNLVYKKYNKSGTYLGTYSESNPGGTAPVSGITLDVYN